MAEILSEKRNHDKLLLAAIGSALDGYASSGGRWEKAKAIFEESVSADMNVLKALQGALAVAKEGAESSMRDAGLRFWTTLQPKYQGETVLSPDDEVGDGAYATGLLHRPERKEPGSATFSGEFEGVPVIIKHGEKDRLAYEHAVLSAANTPGIPKVLSFRAAIPELGGLSRLVMERLPGIGLDKFLNLDKMWKSRPLDISSAVKITQGIAESLQALGDAGYLYKDLSLSHIIVDKQDNDFKVGLVDVESSLKKNAQGKASPSTNRGTWETMAPEEFALHEMSEASSVYSVGVVLAQLVLGRNIYKPEGAIPDADSELQAVRELHSKLPVLSDISDPSLRVALERALDPKPEHRFQTLQDFVEALPRV
jgi:serine/threonine protein kinase